MANRPTVVAHLSDTHFNGTQHNRDRVSAVFDYINNLPGEIDAILVTGDIADSGQPEQYAEARDTLVSDIPVLVLPGNHDTRSPLAETLLAAAPTEAPVNQSVRIGDNVFLLCDSSIPGSGAGELSAETLHWLTTELAATNATDAVWIALHHPPMIWHMPVMDPIRLAHEDKFAAAVAGATNIVGIFGGHTHSGSVAHFAGHPFLIAPGVSSTLNLPFEGEHVVNPTQPPGLLFHVWDGTALLTHFRSVPVGPDAA